MAVRGKSIEETFNQALGTALVWNTIRWRVKPGLIHAEETDLLADVDGISMAGRRPDILILDETSPPVVIECSYSQSDADTDAQARLGCITKSGHDEIKTAISLHIPPEFRKLRLSEVNRELTSGAPINYALYQRIQNKNPAANNGSITAHRWPTHGFVTGTVFDLVAILSAAALPKEDIEIVASEVAKLIEEAAEGLELALLQPTQKSIASTVHQRSVLKGLRTTMVLWLNALLTQQRLHSQGVSGIPPLHFGMAPNLPSDYVTRWREIIETNWRSIFDPAASVLEIAGNADPRATAQALHVVITAVEKIEVARLGLHINAGAELFPKLSEDRKQAAAFYTQSATAELLANLTILQETLAPEDWRNGELFRERRLADLACGTGTLLRAGYRRIVAFHEQHEGSLESLAQLHRSAMESGLVGADVSPIAAHLTMSSLAAVGIGESYGDTQIGWVAVSGATASTGSLEFFGGSEARDLFDEVAGTSSGIEGDARSIKVPNASMDWILMNPPYSRTRGGQSAFDIAGLSRSERLACQHRWGKLTSTEPVTRKAGMAASFLALALKKIKRNGRIGFVLPMTAAFADSWIPTRRMIEREFDEIVIVAVAGGKVLGSDAFSADTNMEEILLVATRRSETNNSVARKGTLARIHCVTLTQAVTRMGVAGEIANAILKAIASLGTSGETYSVIAGDDELGQLCILSKDADGAPWSSVGVVNADLAIAANHLATGVLKFDEFSESLPVEMSTIGQLFEVGPSHHSIGHIRGRNRIGSFEFSSIKDNDILGPDRSLWEAKHTTQKRLTVNPTHRGYSPEGVGSDQLRTSMREYRSDLYYARNMRWTSQALLAATTKGTALGGRAWTTLGHRDVRVRRALALWANSTLGMLVHWTQGQRTQLGRSTAQIAALKEIPCPRLDQLDGAALDVIAAEFDRLSVRELKPACQSHVDEVRMDIDEAVVTMLGLPSEANQTMASLRLLWCREPSVHGRNKKALELLE